MSAPRPILFSDEGCPFAHRVLAMLDHLGVDVDHREAPPHQRPAGLARYSPSLRVPLFVHGNLVVGESAILLDHLAEEHGLPRAWPAPLRDRTVQRQAMALAEAAIVPVLFKGDEAVPSARLAECIDVLERALAGTPAAPSVPAFHLAPIWLRLRWWRPEGVATRGILARPALAEWLDRVAAIPAVARTARGQHLPRGSLGAAPA